MSRGVPYRIAPFVVAAVLVPEGHGRIPVVPRRRHARDMQNVSLCSVAVPTSYAPASSRSLRSRSSSNAVARLRLLIRYRLFGTMHDPLAGFPWTRPRAEQILFNLHPRNPFTAMEVASGGPGFGVRRLSTGSFALRSRQRLTAHNRFRCSALCVRAIAPLVTGHYLGDSRWMSALTQQSSSRYSSPGAKDTPSGKTKSITEVARV